MKAADNLLGLLHLTDSLFPIGSFAHSDGLESAAQSGAVSTPADLAAWLDACLEDTIGRLDAPAVVEAWTAFRCRSLARLVGIDEELTALRPASAGRRGSRAMGLRLLTGWQAFYPEAALDDVFTLVREGRLGPVLPVAFGVACASAGVDQQASARAFAYSRLAAIVSAAMRLMSIGQTEAHRLLARTLERVPAVIDESIARGARPASFAPAMDIAAMTQQYLHSRLFLS